MGFAIAERLAELGANVILIAGPVALEVQNQKILRIDIVSADQMFEKCQDYFPTCDGAIMVAAVADFKPVKIRSEKIKRSDEILTLSLCPNPDIAASLGRIKRANQLLVGFALETTVDEQKAMGKLRQKNLDLIVLNSLGDDQAGFKFDTNKVTILDQSGVIFTSDLKHKSEIAIEIVNKIIESHQVRAGIS
jgi:phosphopantothenoylcysteine synthetase/decarboxylase